MMKKNFVGVICFWMFVFTNSFAASYTIDGYCARNTSYQCLWCLGGGSTQAGNCKSAYAGCTKGVTNVSVGSSSNGVKCTSSGFCYTSCGTRTRTENGATITEQGSGCLCDTWTVISIEAYCQYGYYYSTDAKECVRCPGVPCVECGMDSEEGMSYGTTASLANMTLEDCYLQPFDRTYSVYSDETGEYIIEGNSWSARCYWTE